MNFTNLLSVLNFRSTSDAFFSMYMHYGKCTDENNITYHYESPVYDALLGSFPSRVLKISRNTARLILGTRRSKRSNNQIFAVIIARWYGLDKRKIKLLLRSELEPVCLDILHGFLCGFEWEDFKYVALLDLQVRNDNNHTRLLRKCPGVYKLSIFDDETRSFDYKTAVLCDDHLIVQETGEHLYFTTN